MTLLQNLRRIVVYLVAFLMLHIFFAFLLTSSTNPTAEHRRSRVMTSLILGGSITLVLFAARTYQKLRKPH